MSRIDIDGIDQCRHWVGRLRAGDTPFWTRACCPGLRTGEWARQDLNLQPTDYESAALTGLSYGPGHSEGTDRGRLLGPSDGVQDCPAVTDPDLVRARTWCSEKLVVGR